MRYVLDASVALKWVLPEMDSPKAVRLRNDFRRNIHELIAPDIFPARISRSFSTSRAFRDRPLCHLTQTIDRA